MISSPPQEAEHVRGKTLTPESPKPVHYPSPSNIPILEKQMDPMFNDPALSVGTPASFQSYPQQTQTPSAQSTTSFYVEQQPAPNFQNVAAHSSVGAAPTEYSQSTGYGAGVGSQTQDTPSIQNYSTHNQALAASYREASSTPGQDTRSAYPVSYDPNLYAVHQTHAQQPQGDQYNAQASTGGINFQALLDTLSPTGKSGGSDQYATPSVQSQPSPLSQTPISSLPAAPNLPPRPPPQEKPATHPNYNPNDDIRSYHPHSQKPPNAQFRGPGPLQTLNTRGGMANQDSLSATRSNQSPSTPGYAPRRSVDLRSATPDDEDARWPPEINKLYEDFLEEERKFVSDGQWDQFPAGSRLFIGNLPTEKVTKRDIFHRFFKHGRLAQISIKQAYGFVQFLDSASCLKALQEEQGRTVRGRKMHLEISKPQRNTKKADSHTDRNGARRRSRSPDYTRGGTGPQPRNVDRYTGSQNAISPREKDSRRFRDDYRIIRSPSPPRGGRGGRGRDRSRDRYDGWRRSRSRSPRRYRSPSPRRPVDDDLPLPHRAPHQIPDVQVLVVNDSLPRDFIRWVEDTFKQQGLRIDVLILSPRLSEAAVVRRQIVEGVLAIVRLSNTALAKGKVNLQVFDRRGGADNVQFNEYADLEPATAAALVVREKQAQSQPLQPPTVPSYGQGYGVPSLATPTYNNAPPLNPYPPTPTSSVPDLSKLISSLDSNSLSQLLGAMSQSNPSQALQPAPTALTPDLARLLGSVSTPSQPVSYSPSVQPPSQQYPNSYQNNALASLLPGRLPVQPSATDPAPTQMPTPAPASGQPDMNEIMAQLAKYQR
ncbi:hypothetical protein CC78DRAFT_581413 [Lojkania enalia]|uniref:RRM domain-containing protein n=1 Tax=Lojkania enalia TaxID=147567 RepID=A0A9P4K955_9PLEO|nr:hypothetical protein CC78DRAFT_581413 [Didymosphaeria enalia]